MARTLVRTFKNSVRYSSTNHITTDVIVLAAMGEEAAIDAKEAPKG